MDKILELTESSEQRLANLPNDSLEDMLSSLQVILINLKQQEKDINALQARAKTASNAFDVNEMIAQMKQKILDLIMRTSGGIAFITVS